LKALDLGPCGCRLQQCQPLCFWLGGLSSITQYSVEFWHDGPLLVYYCHGLSCSASGLQLSCFIMLCFRFTTVTGPLHVYYMSHSYPIKKIPLILLSVFYHHVSVLFSSSLLLLYFFVRYSHIEPARFVIVYYSCVPIHKTKRSMSRLTNPITPNDFFIIEIRLS